MRPSFLPHKIRVSKPLSELQPSNSDSHSRILYYEDSQPPKDGAGHKMWGDGLSALFRRLSFTRDSQGIVADAWLGDGWGMLPRWDRRLLLDTFGYNRARLRDPPVPLGQLARPYLNFETLISTS